MTKDEFKDKWIAENKYLLDWCIETSETPLHNLNIFISLYPYESEQALYTKYRSSNNFTKYRDIYIFFNNTYSTNEIFLNLNENFTGPKYHRIDSILKEVAEYERKKQFNKSLQELL